MLTEFLKAINYTKQDILTEEIEKEYVPYVINHCLSGTVDTVLYAQEMNQRHFLDKRMQFDYLRHAVRKGKRFAKWLKQEKSEDITAIQKYYQCNRQRACEYLPLLSDVELTHIKKSLDIGGVKPKSKSS
jgi:hypothetical protein